MRAEVERRLDRPFARVQAQLEELFGKPWDEVEIHIATASDKKDRSEADVIEDLVGRAETKPPVAQQFRRKVIRWIGKPWRERDNPWDKYRDRVPPSDPAAGLRRPPPTSGEGEAWRPIRPED